MGRIATVGGVAGTTERPGVGVPGVATEEGAAVSRVAPLTPAGGDGLTTRVSVGAGVPEVLVVVDVAGSGVTVERAGVQAVRTSSRTTPASTR